MNFIDREIACDIYRLALKHRYIVSLESLVLMLFPNVAEYEDARQRNYHIETIGEGIKPIVRLLKQRGHLDNDPRVYVSLPARTIRFMTGSTDVPRDI